MESAFALPRRVRGRFAGAGGVVVADEADAALLVAHGGYGKGQLSRGAPSFRRDAERARRAHENQRRRRRRRRRRLSTAAATDEEAEPSAEVEAEAEVGSAEESPGRGESKDEVVERLQLSLPEAFFLLDPLAVGALVVEAADGKELGVAECWAAFCRIEPRFPELYACYHQLRALGWVPRSGAKLGCDFLAYRFGPEYSHAAFCVLALREGAAQAPLQWPPLQCALRVSHNVAKKLLLCRVTLRGGEDYAGLSRVRARFFLFERATIE
jgi:tRNA-splicing endonuclease subunit Sen2